MVVVIVSRSGDRKLNQVIQVQFRCMCSAVTKRTFPRIVLTLPTIQSSAFRQRFGHDSALLFHHKCHSLRTQAPVAWRISPQQQHFDRNESCDLTLTVCFRLFGLVPPKGEGLLCTCTLDGLFSKDRSDNHKEERIRPCLIAK